jgi:hypothetical protein
MFDYLVLLSVLVGSVGVSVALARGLLELAVRGMTSNPPRWLSFRGF